MENQTFSSQSREDGTIVISSGERLTLENAADTTKCISEALAASPRVAVEFAATVEVDLTALQILCSACKTAAAEGKSLTHQGADMESWRQLIVSAGAERLAPCRHNNNNPCIWFGGKQ